jgi:hypothetical protein
VNVLDVCQVLGARVACAGAQCLAYGLFVLEAVLAYRLDPGACGCNQSPCTRWFPPPCLFYEAGIFFVPTPRGRYSDIAMTLHVYYCDNYNMYNITRFILTFII